MMGLDDNALPLRSPDPIICHIFNLAYTCTFLKTRLRTVLGIFNDFNSKQANNNNQ